MLDTSTGAWMSARRQRVRRRLGLDQAHAFTLPAPLARFFASGTTLQIRYGTTSNADASDIDQLLVTGTR